MNGKELLERGLRRGIPLWQMEDELDWQESAASARQSLVVPHSRGLTAKCRASCQLLLLLFGWFFKRAVHLTRSHSHHK